MKWDEPPLPFQMPPMPPVRERYEDGTPYGPGWRLKPTKSRTAQVEEQEHALPWTRYWRD